ncbi:MAG: TlpA disulfide reductase family protein [Alphaproteobacteria bacterium]
MRTILAALALALAGAGAARAEAPESAGPRMVAPDGAVVTLDSVLGPQPLVLNIWATWCGPCREELPSLAGLDAWLRPQGGAVLLVAAEPSLPDIVNKFLHERLGVTALDSFVDRAGLIAAAFHVQSYPTTVILDADGRILETIGGMSTWDSPSMRSYLGQWLSAQP